MHLAITYRMVEQPRTLLLRSFHCLKQLLTFASTSLSYLKTSEQKGEVKAINKFLK